MTLAPLQPQAAEGTPPSPPPTAPASTTIPPPTHRAITTKAPPFTYLHLTLISSLSTPYSTSKDSPIDILTARAYFTSALEQFLGVTGTAIPIDFLKVEGREVWIRVPREDASMVVGAVSQWVGREGGVSWRVRGRGELLGSLGLGDGRGLFEP